MAGRNRSRPIPELRRLLDLNLGYLYQDKVGKLLGAGKSKEARDAAAKAVQYMPSRPEAHITLGLLEYLVGDKGAALAELCVIRTRAGGCRCRCGGTARDGRWR